MSLLFYIIMILILVLISIVIYRIKRINKAMLFIFAISSVAILALIIIYFTTYQRYSFSVSQIVETGKTEIIFSVPKFNILKGGYDLIVEPLDNYEGPFRLKGYVQDKGETGNKYHFEGNIDYKSTNRIEIGINVREAIKRKGLIIIDITASDMDAKYKLFFGRTFP